VDLEETELSGERVLSEDVSFLISHVLHDNNARSQAFGETSFLNVRGHPEVSVKTGTTNDRRDNWTVGYTKYATVVTWVGNNNYTSMSGGVSGVSGASPIWNRIMREVLDKAEDGFYDEDDEGHAWPSQTEGVIGANICATTGLAPVSADAPDCPLRFEYFLKGTVPDKAGGERADLQINKTNGQIAAPDTPPEFLETQNHPIFTDPLGTIYCLDCPIASASATIRYPLR
jgi:membrane carboxypeptidase/penicillin-binding protein PbpC